MGILLQQFTWNSHHGKSQNCYCEISADMTYRVRKIPIEVTSLPKGILIYPGNFLWVGEVVVTPKSVGLVKLQIIVMLK